MMYFFGLIFFSALLLFLLYTVRNVLALPLQLVLQLFGSTNAQELSRFAVGLTGTLFWLFLVGSFLIWVSPIFAPAFTLIGDNLAWFAAQVPEALKFALSCWTSKGC